MTKKEFEQIVIGENICIKLAKKLLMSIYSKNKGSNESARMLHDDCSNGVFELSDIVQYMNLYVWEHLDTFEATYDIVQERYKLECTDDTIIKGLLSIPSKMMYINHRDFSRNTALYIQDANGEYINISTIQGLSKIADLDELFNSVFYEEFALYLLENISKEDIRKRTLYVFNALIKGYTRADICNSIDISYGQYNHCITLIRKLYQQFDK